ncbi:Uncharacterised protein [Pandoraea pnomenusa]|uniref:Uncharacterized protein n=2 Tax=Pandoraea pnomenusa TaxID=93220 RepID=A0A378YWT5_9BURK|nr:Uncharacterised protein [Pandoraea pnomenusa]
MMQTWAGHLVKDAKKGDLVKSLVGSQAFSNLARHVLIAMRVELPNYDEDGPSVGVLIRAKTNIGKTGGGRLYEIHPAWVNDRDGREIDTSRLIWHSKVLPASPSDLREWAASKKNELASSPRNRAQEFLMRLLVDGPVPVREINSLAEDDGITPKMLRSAKEKLGVVSERVSNGRGDVWHEWALPADAIGDPARPLDADPEELGQLGQLGQPGQSQETYELGDPSAMQKLFDSYMAKNGKPW